MKNILEKEEFIQEKNNVKYKPNNESYLYCLEIEMNCVNQELVTGDIIEREYICSQEEGINFFNKGLITPHEVNISEYDNKLLIEMSFKKYISVVKNGLVKLVESSYVEKANITFDFEKFEILKDALFDSSDLKVYFSDNCYSLWDFVCRKILYKFRDVGVNVLDKIRFVETGEGVKFGFYSLGKIEELFLLNQYSINLNTNNDYELTNERWLAFDKTLLKKLSPSEMLKEFKLEQSPFAIKMISKNLYYLFLINDLEKLGFNKREISILLSKGCVSLGVIKTQIFNLYLKKLSKKDILRKLTKHSNCISTLLDIDFIIHSLNLAEEHINFNVSISNLEKILLKQFNDNQNLNLNNAILKDSLSFISFRNEKLELINALSDKGFNNNDIYVLIDKGFEQKCFNSSLFNLLIENLTAEEFMKKIDSCETICTTLNFIDRAIECSNFNILKCLSMQSLLEIEFNLLEVLNKKGIAWLNKTIHYSLPNIDYSNDEQLIYSNGNYSLKLPLKTNKFAEYGTILKNCIGSIYKRTLLKGQVIMGIKNEEDELIGAIRIDNFFENLIECKGCDNKDLPIEELEFVIEFCNKNEIEYKVLNKNLRRA